MTCNTWGVISLLGAIFLAWAAYSDIGISQDVGWGSAAGLFVAAIAAFIIRRVNPMIES